MKVTRHSLAMTDLADWIGASGGQVCDLDSQVWGIRAEVGGIAGEHLGKCPSSYALPVLVHAPVKQEPAVHGRSVIHSITSFDGR